MLTTSFGCTLGLGSSVACLKALFLAHSFYGFCFRCLEHQIFWPWVTFLWIWRPTCWIKSCHINLEYQFMYGNQLFYAKFYEDSSYSWLHPEGNVLTSLLLSHSLLECERSISHYYSQFDYLPWCIYLYVTLTWVVSIKVNFSRMWEKLLEFLPYKYCPKDIMS